MKGRCAPTTMLVLVATTVFAQNQPGVDSRKKISKCTTTEHDRKFAVFEKQTDQRLSVALIVDASGSTAKDLKFEAESASRFLKALLTDGNPRDRVALYSFNWQVSRYSNFTRSYTGLANIFKDAGADTITSKNLKQAVEAVHLADAVVYPVVVVPITNDASRNIGRVEVRVKRMGLRVSARNGYCGESQTGMDTPGRR